MKSLVVRVGGGTAFWFVIYCYSVVAERHFGLRIGCCCSCRLLLLGRGGTPFWFAHWMLFALRSVVARLWHIAISFCALEVICFAVCCCSAGGISPFYSAHWMLLLLRTVVTRKGRIAILVCTLDVVCFAVCCCPAVAYRHFILRLGHSLLRNPLQLGNRGRARCA